MANAKGVASELKAFSEKVLRVTALEVQGQMKKMTPVDTGQLRSAVQVDMSNLPESVTVFNNLRYAQRVYLEGHSKQLPQGEFQAYVASIPSRMEAIARGLGR